MPESFIVPPFVPRVHVSRYKLREGDTLEGIAEAFGLSGCAYGEIVGANLERGLTSKHVAPGYPLKLAGLAAGDMIKLPVWWPVASVGVGGGSVNPGEDNALDPVTLEISNHLHTLTGDNDQGILLQEDLIPAYFNAISQWYRADNGPDAKPPTFDEFKPYLLVCNGWWHLYGQNMAKEDREHLAWTAFPFDVAVQDLQFLSMHPTNWEKVRDWANQAIKPGMVKNKPSPAKFLWRSQNFGAKPWSVTPWNLPFSQVPAWAIPWGYTDFLPVAKMPQGTSPDVIADLIIKQIGISLGVVPKFPVYSNQEGGPSDAQKQKDIKDHFGGKDGIKLKKDGAKKEPGAGKQGPEGETKEAPAPARPWGAIAVGGVGLAAVGYFVWKNMQRKRARKG